MHCTVKYFVRRFTLCISHSPSLKFLECMSRIQKREFIKLVLICVGDSNQSSHVSTVIILFCLKTVPLKVWKGWFTPLGPLFLRNLKKLLVLVLSAFCIMSSQDTPCPNIALTPTSIVPFMVVSMHVNTGVEDRSTWCIMWSIFLILTWMNSCLGQAEDRCPQGGLLSSLECCYCIPSRWESWDQLRGEMEIMAVYRISFIMSCLLACCFIATLLHSRPTLVYKLYIFTLIWSRYNIKINEFMFLIHQKELSLVIYRWSIKMGQEASPMHFKYHIDKEANEQALLTNVQFHLTS